MAGELQPLVNNQRIVNPDGTPTDYFIRWAQQRQLDISGGITAQQAQELIDAYIAAHALQAGTGIAITPSGRLSDDPTILLHAVFGDLQDVDMTTTPPTDGQVPIWNAADSKGSLETQAEAAAGIGGLHRRLRLIFLFSNVVAARSMLGCLMIQTLG